ncbi:MAG: CvpA family protein [Lachnospiraceae bacterium]|nr:CvpA family protein [Lachnospiraceae bacterium]
MFNWLLLIVILFFVIMGIYGFNKGFVKSLFSLVTLILTVIFTVIISPHIATWVKENTGMYDAAKDGVCEFIANLAEAAEEEAGESKEIDELPLPEAIRDFLDEHMGKDEEVDLSIDKYGEKAGAYIANIVINAATFIATFIVIMIILKVLVQLLDVISKLPVLNGVNRLAGTALGLLEALIIVWILCVAVTAGASTDLGLIFLEQINESDVLSFLYNNNYLMRVISDVLEMTL